VIAVGYCLWANGYITPHASLRVTFHRQPAGRTAGVKFAVALNTPASAHCAVERKRRDCF